LKLVSAALLAGGAGGTIGIDPVGWEVGLTDDTTVIDDILGCEGLLFKL